MSNKYNHTNIETKWQEVWSKTELYKTDLGSNKKKYYNLVMFPYPSADFLHLGHAFNFSGADVYARYKKLNDFNVFEPIGYDAFGLPAENFAIKKGIHPREVIEGSIKHSEEQLNSWGCMFDWSKKMNTSDPSYYKWTQWLFLKMYEKGLAYQKEAPVNWCPGCKTVLANEQVSDGECERCGSKVEIKNMKQWFFKITDYADRLIKDLDKVDWPESSKAKHKNWIGRSEGTIVKFPIAPVIISASSLAESRRAAGIQSQNEKGDGSLGLRQGSTIKEIEVFTTRVDTIFGCTYLVVAPEHPIVMEITTDDNKAKVEDYIKKTQKLSELDRQLEDREKTGVFTGSYAVNPFNGEEVPIWVADYVLSGYGTGVVMAVPAHDERDFEFAKKYELEIKPVIIPSMQTRIKNQDGRSTTHTSICIGSIHEAGGLEVNIDYLTKRQKLPFSGYGYLFNSGEFTDQYSTEAKEKMTQWLQKKELGSKKVNYRLHDWSFSRQRYWGAPIPVIYCEKCASTGSAQAGIIPVPEKDLPIELPEVEDFRPKGTGKGPLATNPDFVNTTCPKCGGKAERETDTMDTFVCSSFYFLRYPSVGNDEEMMDKKITEKWLPVDMYIGGAEHVTMHLLYARFVTKALFDAGLLNFDEPFISLRHQGMILGPDGKKMSKSKGNVIIPDTVVKDYGADAFRINILFMGPFEDGGPWNEKGMKGVQRFLERYWNLAEEVTKHIGSENIEQNIYSSKNIEEALLAKTINKAVKKIGEDTENFKFNTVVSTLMSTMNELYSLKEKIGPKDSPNSWREVLERFTIILAPLAPHITEEVWSMFGYKESVFNSIWPSYDEELLEDDIANVAIQINGKVRGELLIAKDSVEKEVLEEAKKLDNVKKYLEGKEIKKVFYVKGKLLSIVIG